MFKFEFSGENNPTKELGAKTTKPQNEQKWLASREVIPTNVDAVILEDIFKNCEVLKLNCQDSCCKYFFTDDVLNILRTKNCDEEEEKDLAVLSADLSHSDLEAALYEGGLKIWECTFDLIKYIAETDIQLQDKKILDLGCGSGLIGILGLLKGGACTFQDYNVEVLEYLTIPNIKLNGEELLEKCRFYSGDWQSFTDLLAATDEIEKFDYIFTSETIYNTDNYDKLHDTFERLLKKSGEIYLSAKSYYFGVGGGVSLFQDVLKKKNVFQYSSCWKCTDGVNREILKIKFI